MKNFQVLPAFWLRPGDAEGGDTHNANCHKGSKAINTVDTYNYLFAKTVILGCPGVGEDPCFTFNSSVTVAGELPEYDYAQVEGPTGYHTEDFNISSSLDVTTGHLVDYNSSLPLVFSTWDLQHAFGIWAPPGQFTDYPLQYAVFHFPENVRSFADKTNKWSVVWKKNFLPPNTGPWELNYTVFVCVGTQQDAAECLMKLVTYHDHRYR
ncbi:hypothetical protein BaRGS_00011119 [Batillaria attramentaria]|uniref:Uncharacterized protein n=1 Tax=Batillaria attramentaria TaxID=370345 RepID=A0ABD0LFD4_9CAEN